MENSLRERGQSAHCYMLPSKLFQEDGTKTPISYFIVTQAGVYIVRLC